MSPTMIMRELWLSGKLVFVLPDNVTHTIKCELDDTFIHASWSLLGRSGPNHLGVEQTMSFIVENSEYFVC